MAPSSARMLLLANIRRLKPKAPRLRFCCHCCQLRWPWGQPKPDKRPRSPSPVFATVHKALKEGALDALPGLNIMDLRLNAADPLRHVSRDYETIAELGRGAFGAVFKMRSMATGEMRAMKVVYKVSHEGGQALATELQAMLMTDHPNVVKFYNIFEKQQAICIIMELCEGGDFSQLQQQLHAGLAERGELQVLFRDVVSGVAYCHGCGVAHRDLKPANCLLAVAPNRRVAKVIDFGLSAIRRESKMDEEAWLKGNPGSKLFLAPEVWQNSPHCMRCDVWALGVMLFMLLTDEHPFAQDMRFLTTRELKKAVLACRVRRPPLDAAHVEPEARQLLGKLLALKPRDRLEAKAVLRDPWLDIAPELSLEEVAWQASSAELIDGRGPRSTFNKAARMVLAQHAEGGHVDRARQAFMALDRDGNGRISKAELARLDQLRGEEEEEKLSTLVEALDLDLDGEVTWTEWCGAILPRSAVYSTDSEKELFQFLDIDGNGRISHAELSRVVGEGEADRVLRRADNQRGSLSPEDLAALLRAESPACEPRDRG